MGPDLIERCWDALAIEVGHYHEDSIEMGKLSFQKVCKLKWIPGRDFDLLTFDRSLFNDAPQLALCVPVIRGVLCIPSSAAKCERTFSFTTRLINRLTTSLGRDTVEMKTVIKDALNNEIVDINTFVEHLLGSQQLKKSMFSRWRNNLINK